jgi:alpha-1,6-mannosyltransferase
VTSERRGRLAFLAAVVLGLAAAVASVRLVAPLQSAGAKDLLGPWWTWTSRLGAWRREPGAFTRGGVYVAVAVAVLTAAWLAGVVIVRRCRVPVRWTAVAAAVWTLPYAVVPPILSRDAYAYLAQGAVAGSGDPYRSPLAVLGKGSALVQAVDPLYRDQAPPYGPVGLRLLAAVVTPVHQHPVLALVGLRVLVVVCVLVTTVCCVRLVSPEQRALQVWLVAASPVVLLHLVGGLHLEAELVVLLAAALLLHAKGRCSWAASLVVMAAAIKVTAGLVLVVLLALSLRRGQLRQAASEAGAAIATGLLLLLAVGPNPLGWLSALHAPLAVWDPVSAPTATAMAWAELTGGSPVPAVAPVRAVLGAVGLAVVVWLCATSRRREVTTTVGLVLTAVLLTGPLLWSWYFVPAAVCLGARGGRALVPAVALTVAGAFVGLPMPVKQMQRVSVGGYAVVLLVLAVAGLVRLHRSGRLRRGIGSGSRTTTREAAAFSGT